MSYAEGCQRCGDPEPGCLWLGGGSERYDALCTDCCFAVVGSDEGGDDEDG